MTRLFLKIQYLFKINTLSISNPSLAIHSHWHGQPEFGCRLIDDVSSHLTGYLPHTFKYYLRSIITLMYHMAGIFLALHDRGGGGGGGILAKPKFCGSKTTFIVVFVRLPNEMDNR